PWGVRAVSVTLNEFALGVKLQQLFGHVAHCPAGSRFRLLPAEPTELVELRPVPLARRVSLDKIQPLDRDIQARALGIGEQHELTSVAAAALEPGGHVAGRSARGRDLLEPLELADTVVHVDDVVADFQVSE